jgi:hypothetical protein
MEPRNMQIHLHGGVSFRTLIPHVIASKRARRYLEIGVRDGATLALIDCDSIGVDPFFQFAVNPVGRKRRLHLFQETSDQFFRDRNVLELLDGRIDVTFLDGLHQFEFLLRDFMNSERVSDPNGVILLDDCLPVNAEMTERVHRVANRVDKERATWWTGDVWKLVPILKEYRPDLKVTLVDTQPTGTFCVVGLDPNSTVLQEHYAEIVEKFMSADLDDEKLVEYYKVNDVVSSDRIMQNFEASIYVGP